MANFSGAMPPLSLRAYARAPRVQRVITLRKIPRIVQWSFLLFLFTLPFEATAFGSHSFAKLVGLSFFCIYFLHYNPLNRPFPAIPPVMWFFVAYLVLYLASIFRLPPEFLSQFIMRAFTLIQLLVFFWVASDLFNSEGLVRRGLLTYAAAATLFAVAMLLGVPGFSSEVVPGRVTGGGDNPNTVAVHMAIALAIVIGLVLSKSFSSRTLTAGLVAMTLPLMLGMVATGSRGGMAAFVIGIGVYLLPYWKNNRIFAAIGLAGLGIVAVVLLIATSPLLLERWQESYYEGKLSERESIFAVSAEMIGEQPILGWGPVEGNYVLGWRTGASEARDTHNLFFHLLAEGGIVGSIPFLIGLGLSMRYAWRARSKNLGLIPLALLMIVVAANLSGNNLVWKPQWLILALVTAVACGSLVREPHQTMRRARSRLRLPNEAQQGRSRAAFLTGSNS